VDNRALLPPLLNGGQRLHGADKRSLKTTKNKTTVLYIYIYIPGIFFEKSTVTKEERILKKKVTTARPT